MRTWEGSIDGIDRGFEEDEELVRGDSVLATGASLAILDLFRRRTFLGDLILSLLSYERPDEDEPEPCGICDGWRPVAAPLTGSHDFD
jgi:hypothetical protein